MTQNLNDFLISHNNQRYATKNGSRIHALLKHVVIDATFGDVGDMEIVKKIQQHPELIPYFNKSAQTEVPIAGYINGVFISRRLDRILINHDTKKIVFIDYKTDTNKNIFIDKYTNQLQEYAHLLKSAYPDYKISGFILWLQDWQLEQIISV